MLVDGRGFAAFLDEFSISLEFAVKIFAVSRRTVIRWRATDLISATAAQIVRTIRWQAAPWTASGWRGLRVVISQLTADWRELLFAPPGGHWQDYRTAAEQDRAQAHRAACDAYRAADACRRRSVRLKAARKAAATRRANAAAVAARSGMVVLQARKKPASARWGRAPAVRPGLGQACSSRGS